MLAGKGIIRTLTMEEQKELLEKYGEEYLGIEKSEIQRIIREMEAEE